MRYEDLPKALRSRVDAQDATTTRSKPSRAKGEGGYPLRCTRCPFVADPPTEGRLRKHQTEHPTHGRYEHRFEDA